MKYLLPNHRNLILIACIMLGFTTQLTATHITGGEFTYRYLYTQSNKVYYETKLVLYRDCNSSTGFANPVALGIYKATNYSSIGTRSVYMTGNAINVSPICNQTGVCIEKAIYIDTLSFPSTQNYGIIATCGGTARSNAIRNLDLVTGNVGIAWQINIPPPNSYKNSSPQFINEAERLICTKKQTVLNNNIYDADGDSLVFSFAQPYGSTNPSGGYPSSGYPVQPPLSNTLSSWASGYSDSQPFGSSGTAVIDSITGEMTLTAPSSSTFVLAIQIDEYKRVSNAAAIYMGETRRDIQITSKSLANYYSPKITNYGGSTTKSIHAGKNNCFNISGIDSLGDSITISAIGIMFDTIYMNSSLATFNTKSDDSIVTQQFCWSPSCSQVSSTPYIMTVTVTDKNCYRSEKTFSILVDTLDFDSITANICAGDTFNFNGTKLTTQGTYIDSFVQNVCNSNNIITTLTLNVNSASSSSIADNICQGTIYHFNGKKINTAGTYTDTLVNAGGCDSVITLNLNILSPSSDSISAAICQGKKYNFNGKNISKAGIYYDTTTNYLGCDSIIKLNLQVNNATTDTIIVGICAGFSYTFKGQNISKTGFYYDTTANYLGCDSFIVLNLIAGNYNYNLIQDTICQGDVYSFNGKNISTAGNYADTLKGTKGCDSVVALVLTVNALKQLGNISGQQNVFMHHQHIYSVSDTTASGYVWTVTGGTIISGQGTDAIKVLWDTTVTGSISVYATCYDTSNLNIYISNSINSIIQQADIRIYPNPSEGSFNIQFNNPLLSKSELSIYNSLGQKVYNTILPTGTNMYKVELENVSKGFYYMYMNAVDISKVYRIIIK